MPNASDVIGRDECACCEPTRAGGQLSYERDDMSGICLVRRNLSYCMNQGADWKSERA